MKINKFFNEINLDRSDRYYLIALFCFSILITIVMIKFHQTRGAFNSDIFRYLPAALDFAGLNYNHISDPSWMFNSPVIFYLTSLMFKLGFVHINSIFFVTGIFGIIGIFGMYAFLKVRFSPLLSFTGALLYSSFSLTLFYFANGMLDTSAVAMFLWTIVFLVAATKNYKFYPILAISFLISIFIRFTNTYTLSLIVLYILKDYDLVTLIESLFYNKIEFKQRISTFFKSHEFKYILLSISLSVIIIAYVFHVLLSYGSVIGYFGMASNSFSHFHSLDNFNYVDDRLFYFKNYLSLLFTDSITSIGMIEQFNNPSLFSYIIIGIFAIGAVLKFINVFKNLKVYKNYRKELDFKHETSYIFYLAIVLILGILSIILMDYNYLMSLLCIWLIFLILISIIKLYPVNKDNFSFSLVCLALFIFYMIIFSLMDLKCVRYILITFTSFTYFFIYFLDVLLNFIKFGWDDEEIIFSKFNSIDLKEIKKPKSNLRKNFSRCIPIVIILICLFSAFNFTNTVEVDKIGLSIDDVSNYLIDYDPDYQSKKIGVKSGEMFYEWYFQKKIDVVDVDNLNNSYYDYIITWPELNDDNYKEIYNSNGTFLYEKY